MLETISPPASGKMPEREEEIIDELPSEGLCSRLLEKADARMKTVYDIGLDESLFCQAQTLLPIFWLSLLRISKMLDIRGE